jgi:hypothetical protein
MQGLVSSSRGDAVMLRLVVGELKRQFISALFAILTLAAVIAAGINLQQQSRYQLPDDGVTWVEGAAGVVATHVVAGSPADNGGIRKGDVLTGIESVAIRRSLDVPQVLMRIGSWKPAKYHFQRGGRSADANVIIGERHTSHIILYQYFVGALYLAIGLFVYLRRGSAQKAIHFYSLCLSAFVLFCFHYTGKLNNFDKVIYWGNILAGLLTPALLLHFALAFGRALPATAWKRRGLYAAIYVPALVLFALYGAFAFGLIRVVNPLVEMIWMLDRAWLALMCLFGALSAGVFWRAQNRSDDPILRAQLSWLRNGILFGVAPFAMLYALGIRDFALSPDGCRYHLPAGLRVHGRHARRSRCALRGDLLRDQSQGSDAAGAGGADPDCDVCLSADSRLDRGKSQSIRLLQRQLRLPTDLDRVRAGTRLTDRS